MRARFSAPAHFDPSYSLLGRMLRKRISDRKRAGAHFVVATSVLVMAMVVAQFFAWSYLEPAVMADPGGEAATAFWIGQIAAVLLLTFGAVTGRAPKLQVTLEGGRLDAVQGSRSATVPLSEIEEILPVSAVQFHREYLPFADVRAFNGRSPKAWVVIRTAQGALGIGLPASDYEEFCGALREGAARAPAKPATRAV